MRQGRPFFVALFAVGDFVLEFSTVVLGTAEPENRALHVFRAVVLAPVYFMGSSFVALILEIQHGSGPEGALFIFLSLLLLNTALWTICFNLGLRAVYGDR
jgi:hypothetical protein